jgi:hypothetical protein
MVHSGAYVARDEVIEAAQQGKIIITCAGERDRYRSNPDRTKLSRDFWNNAELVDAGHWQAPGSSSCVARRIDQPAKEFRDLLVGSAKAKEVWSPAEPSAELATAAPADTNWVGMKAPPEFLTWAKEQKKAGKVVTYGKAEEAMKAALPTPPGRATLRAWIKDLPDTERAKRGTPPAKR